MTIFRLFFACISVALVAAVATHAQDVPDAPADRIADLIHSLRDPDPAARARAATELRQLGAAARPAIVRASRGDDAALAPAAGELLLSMPWHRDDDHSTVRKALRNYGAGDVAQRIQTIAELANFPRPVVNPVLVRLLGEEPNEDVCWHIVATLRRRMDAPTREMLRSIEPDPSRGSNLAMAARAWLGEDVERARELMRRAIEVESRSPSYDDGELDFAYDMLGAAAVATGDYDAAADVLRQQAARVGLQRTAFPGPVFRLFALHARHGPLRGFADDAATFAAYLAEPEVMYALAQAYARCGDALAAHACARAAAVGTLRAGERVQVGGFLAGVGWTDAAERELRAVVAAPGEADVLIHQLNARMRLSFLAAARDDDAAAAEHLRAAVGLLEKAGDVRRTDEDGRETPFRPADLRDDLAWRSFRAARAANDRAAMDKHADELIALKPVQTEILVDVVPHLKAGGRIAEAAKLFEHAYAVKRARLDAQPNEPSVMNEVAWLCARSGERLDEALELATRAVELAPDSAAYFDTAAEANFQVGRVREAVRLETKALELEPGDAFMTEQLERFNSSAPPPPATQPNTRGSPATRPVTNW